jgi:maltose/moltooligosaccharide transporter
MIGKYDTKEMSMAKRKFPWGTTFLVGFGFLGISILWPIFNQYVPLILQAGNPAFNAELIKEGREIPTLAGFAMAPTLAMFVMTWDNIINIFMQPWIGNLSDRTWTRIGRRKPWILVGLPIAILGFVAIPFAQILIALMVFILITNFGMALFRTPVVAWLGDLFTPDERGKANGVINLMGGVGGVLAFVGGGILFKALGDWGPFAGGAIGMALALIVVLLFVVEPKEKKGESEKTESFKGIFAIVGKLFKAEDKSGVWLLVSILFWFIAYNTLETGLSSFAVFSLGIKAGTASILAALANLSFIIFAIPSGLIAQKLGRRNTIIYGLIGLVPVFLLSFFFVKGMLTFIIVLILTGFFWAWINVNSLPLVYDFGEESQIGAYTGLYYFASQLAAVLGPVAGGFVVERFGSNYRLLFIFGTVFMALALITMLLVKNKKPQQSLKAS